MKEMTFTIKNLDFEIVQQSNESYAVRVYDGLDRMWLDYPESRYETINGACYGILKWLDALEFELNQNERSNQ